MKYLRQPNSEQLLAIEHQGGKVLSAGAGSGKTFVLVEHVLYLANQFLDHHPKEKLGDFFSSIVLMTFTKKAQAEIESRIIQRVKKTIEVEDDEQLKMRWKTILDFLPQLSVTTIHGFCFKLISMGYFPYLSPDVEISSDIRFELKIKRMLDSWLEQSNNSQKDFINVHRLSIEQSLIEIFSSPEARSAWLTTVDTKRSIEDGIALFLEMVISERDLDFDFTVGDLDQDKDWVRQLLLFLDFYRKFGPIKVENFYDYLDFFNSFQARRPGKVSENYLSAKEFLSRVLDLKAKLMPFRDEFVLAKDCSESLNSWIELFVEIITFIEKNYRTDRELTFSDLEYYVFNELRHSQSSDLVAQQFRYFIIDEFQDTSKVQFDIVKKIINEDYRKVFCVGDVKQAIYGFRGGSVSVFQNAQKFVGEENCLYLKANYRSSGKIVSFNNELYHRTFPLGSGWEGQDSHSVEFTPQVPMVKDEADSGVEVCVADIVDAEKMSIREINACEANVLFSVIQNCVDQGYKEICVLYRTMGPSTFLLSQLLSGRNGGEAQIKVPFGEDPLLAIAYSFLVYILNQDEFVFKSHLQLYLRCLKLDSLFEISHSKIIERIKYWNLKTSFYLFLNDCGIRSSMSEISLKNIDEVFDLVNGNVELAAKILQRKFSDTYSFEYRFGEKTIVKIMSVHASKGLEFDVVMLGGIHTNGKSPPESYLIGKTPESIKWKTEKFSKKLYRSPSKIYDDLLKKEMEFSETKRLLYVATTRAKSKLIWARLHSSLKAKTFSFHSNSWIHGLSKHESGAKLIELSAELGKQEMTQAPFFHQDALGVFQVHSQVSWAISGELSVTRLTSAIHCSRLFYLENVCRFNDEDLEILGLKSDILIENAKESDEASVEDDELKVFSSKKRGSLLHYKIHQYLKRENHSLGQTEELSWIVTLLDQRLEGVNDFDSEVGLKFELFGFMISGVPDLVIEKKEIWDFKTGAYDEEKNEAYLFQLKCYAVALSSISNVDQFKLVIAYIDDKKTLEYCFDIQQIENDVFEVWKSIQNPEQMNQSYCRKCSYRKLCHTNQ